MNLRIQLFAGLAEAIGSTFINVELGEKVSVTAAELKSLLTELYPQASSQIAQAFLAVNHEYAADEAPITLNDEIALIPPVSGGEPSADSIQSADGLYHLTSLPLNVEEITQRVIHPDHGASLVFVGTTREMTAGKRTVYLEYEAYAPMALKKLQWIGAEIGLKWPGALCAISHRTGKVDIAEASVVIAVSAPHRESCYEASRYAIEQLKRIVPIWKKEIWDDGSEWKGAQQGPWNPISEKN
ncbi:molybdopterin converting factor [Paenibacillus yonginensis]|uniref:Molybdopterin synthase catalytic subunit n=1 Tax=Paenibacillus yonginensis TaxID=1462996 RepID=A0A1B1MX26_9BACL|nr:molybdenum cofactor biosynthesis protein MoaE [Paenibacillus yonginensis]ANS73718.1 molybdopterin converting factor [Paenibacillus yonginensis]